MLGNEEDGRLATICYYRHYFSRRLRFGFSVDRSGCAHVRAPASEMSLARRRRVYRFRNVRIVPAGDVKYSFICSVLFLTQRRPDNDSYLQNRDYRRTWRRVVCWPFMYFLSRKSLYFAPADSRFSIVVRNRGFVSITTTTTSSYYT